MGNNILITMMVAENKISAHGGSNKGSFGLKR